jgi:hypothetical protein
MKAIKLMIAGAALGAGTALAMLLGMGGGSPERTEIVSRPVPADVRALVAAMPAEAPATKTAAEKEALASAVLAALARAEEAPAGAETAAVLRAAGPEDAPAFRLETSDGWAAASGETSPATELRPMPRRN